jgi:hypothetical protein
VQKVGRPRAGRVLHHVPSFLGPQARFIDVARGFITRSRELYPGQPNVEFAARHFFVNEGGIGREIPTGGPC